MERARRTGTKKQSREAVRAALRAAREGGAARSDQWEAKEEKDVYEQVTEQEYADLVRKRRQNEDFVVDDDGLGYFDDGEEHFGEDEAEGLEAAAPKQRGVVHARSKDAVRKARKLKEARSENEERQTTKMTQFLGNDGEKKAPKKPVAAVKQLDAFESLIDGLGSGAAPERKSVDLGGGLGFANEAPSGPKVAPTPRRMTYDEVSPMPLWSAGVDLESSIGGAGDDMGMGFGMADDEPVPAALPPAKDAPLPLKATAAPKKKSRFSKTDVVVEASSAAVTAMAMDVDKPVTEAPQLPERMTSTRARPRPTRTTAAAPASTRWRRGSGSATRTGSTAGCIG